ncbi:MAG: GDP-L-fucose synthase [Bacteroidales bacterium]|nr:GDP-L-fucose synthase [Bacteroidales bacterium]
MIKNSKIYLAGHTGLVGSAIHRKLSSAGYTNIIYRSFEELDLRDPLATEKFFSLEKPEYVILAAAKVGGIMANNEYRADFLYENLQIQNNIIYQSYKHGIKKLIFLGSSCIYPKNAPQPLKEDSLLTSELEYTNEPYAIAKITGIKLCESFNLQYGTNFISLMPTNLYGPGDNFDLEKSHVLPAIIRKLHLGKALQNHDFDTIRKDFNKHPVGGVTGQSPNKEIIQTLEKFGISRKEDKACVTFWGTGSPRREFLHSDDLAAAILYVFENIDFKDLVDDPSKFDLVVKNIRNTHLNIGSGSDLTIRELVDMVKEIVGYKGIIEWDKSLPDGTAQKLMDGSRIRALGWKDGIPLHAGIADVYSNYCK